MATLANKLAELTRRALDLEAKIALQGRQAAFFAEHGRPLTQADQTIAEMEKRLASLQRSCQILARHASA